MIWEKLDETNQVHSSKIAKASPSVEESDLYCLSNLTTEAPGERKITISCYDILRAVCLFSFLMKNQTYPTVRVVLNYVPTISLNNSIQNASLLSGETRYLQTVFWRQEAYSEFLKYNASNLTKIQTPCLDRLNKIEFYPSGESAGGRDTSAFRVVVFSSSCWPVVSSVLGALPQSLRLALHLCEQTWQKDTSNQLMRIVFYANSTSN